MSTIVNSEETIGVETGEEVRNEVSILELGSDGLGLDLRVRLCVGEQKRRKNGDETSGQHFGSFWVSLLGLEIGIIDEDGDGKQETYRSLARSAQG